MLGAGQGRRHGGGRGGFRGARGGGGRNRGGVRRGGGKGLDWRES